MLHLLVLLLVRIIHKIEIPYSIPYQQQLALFRFLGFLAIVCHWLACVWAMTLKVVDKAGAELRHMQTATSLENAKTLC